MGELDNTLFFYIIGDNGSSAEVGLAGTLNEMLNMNGRTDVDTAARQLKRLEEFGSPLAYNHFAAGTVFPASARWWSRIMNKILK